MSKRLGLAIVAAGLMLSLSGVADAAVVVRGNSSRTVVTRHVRTGNTASRRVNHRHHHHRRVVNVHHNKANVGSVVAHRGHRHSHHRHGSSRRWQV